MRASDRASIAEECIAKVLDHLRTPKMHGDAPLISEDSAAPYPTVGLQERELRAARGGFEWRESIIAPAIEARKFPRERADYYRSLYDADPETARSLIDALTPLPNGVEDREPEEPYDTDSVPVGDPAGDDDYPRSWLQPQERQPSASPVHIERD